MLNADQTVDVRSPWCGRVISIEEGLVKEEDEQPANAGQDGADPEAPAPSGAGYDERGDQRPQVRTQDDGKLNIVDYAGMLVKEEEILDPHQGSPLAHAAEEAIDDASCKIGVKRGRGRRPDTSANHNSLEEKGDGQAAEEVCEGDDEQAACSNGEQITDHSPLHRSLCQVPLTTTRPYQSLHYFQSHNGKECMNLGSHIHRLRNDGDNSRPTGVVGQCSNVRDNCHDNPFLPGTPIEGIFAGIEGLGNQDETVVASFQSCRMVWIATWVNDVAFECLCLFVDFDAPKVGGRLFERSRSSHGRATEKKNNREAKTFVKGAEMGGCI